MTAKRTRKFPRGSSPFCSPRVGDVVRGDGSTRTVVDIDYGFNPFTVTYESDTMARRTVNRASWTQWCSRTQAELVSRVRITNSCGNVFADLGLPDAEELKRKAESGELESEIRPTPMPEPDVHQSENLRAHIAAGTASVVPR